MTGKVAQSNECSVEERRRTMHGFMHVLVQGWLVQAQWLRFRRCMRGDRDIGTPEFDQTLCCVLMMS